MLIGPGNADDSCFAVDRLGFDAGVEMIEAPALFIGLIIESNRGEFDKTVICFCQAAGCGCGGGCCGFVFIFNAAFGALSLS